jgi:hypothetical protein
VRRATVIGVTLLGIAAAVLIGVGAYHAGMNHGLTDAGHASQVIRVVGPGYYHGGFFPGFLLFPLFIIGIIFLMRGLFWGGGRGRGWGGPGGPGGNWGGDRGAMFEDWHRRQHEQASGDHPGSGGEPAQT